MNLPSNCHCTADILFKLPALDQLFRTDEQDEGTFGSAEHTVDLVDADVAVLCRFLGGEGHLEVNENSFDLVVFHGFDSFHKSKNVDGLNWFFRGLSKNIHTLEKWLLESLVYKGFSRG